MEAFNESAQEQTSESMPVAWQHDKVLTDCMIELYENNLWTDVKFRCTDHDEHERIHAHKIVLAARSPVFQAKFYGPCAAGNEEMMLDDIKAETFDIFLRFLYQDKVTLTEDIAASVLKTAHYYQVTNLVLYCADFLGRCITSQNVCDILSLARRYDVISLCKTCCRFIDDHADEVMETEDFLKISEDTLTYIMKGDLLYADEVDIFKKAEEWAHRKIQENNSDKHGQNIRKVLGSSFFHLRLPTMTSENLLKCTRRKGYFTAEEYEDLVDFINESPDTSVKTNSCIRRLPTEEHIDCNDGEEDISDRIMTTFQVSVSRDVEVKTVELTKIHTHLKFDKPLYMNNVLKSVNFSGDNFKSFVGQFQNKVIKLGDCSFDNRFRIKIFEAFPTEDLLQDVVIAITGTLKVTTNKKKIVITGEEEEEDEEEEKEKEEEKEEDSKVNKGEKLAIFGSSDYDVDENLIEDKSDNDIEGEEKEYLVFEQEIEMNSMDETQRVVSIKESHVLEESRSPYTFTLNLNFKNARSNMITMKTLKTSEKAFTSSHGTIKVEDISGNFSGIQRICFENISNRD